MGVEALTAPVTLGVATGLAAGKLVGIFGTVAILLRAGFGDLPAGAS